MKAPTVETLERLRPQTVRLLDEPAGLCPEGGRLLAKSKIGGYSARRVVHWVETGEYPQSSIKPECGVENCVDCGRSPLAENTVPPAPPIPQPPPPPVTPPPPAPPPVPGVGLERVGGGGQERSSCLPVPVSVPGPRSSAPRRVLGVVRRLWPVWLLLAGFLLLVAALQGGRKYLSNDGVGRPVSQVVVLDPTVPVGS